MTGVVLGLRSAADAELNYGAWPRGVRARGGEHERAPAERTAAAPAATAENRSVETQPLLQCPRPVPRYW
jgi:hypothetical protein